MFTEERAVEKLVLRYISAKWMVPQTHVVEYFLYTKASLPARKMSLFSSMITRVILSYTIIRIYIILHIYLQVSETEELAELQ